MSIVALIPARAGSKRVLGKNTRVFHGHPLIAYTIASALQSEVFDRVVVSTESEDVADVARRYGAEVPFLRPAEFARDLSADFEWVSYTMERLAREEREYSYFSILRPTNPFRLPETIKRAWGLFSSECAAGADSLRAVEKCGQHPYKMWVLDEGSCAGSDARARRMKPFVSELVGGRRGYSLPYQALPEVYAQNASLEISRTDVLLRFGEIMGEAIVPFVTEGYEGFDINTQLDWEYGARLAESGEAKLPVV